MDITIDSNSPEVNQINNTFSDEVLPNNGKTTELPIDRLEMIDPPTRGTQKQNYETMSQYPVFRFYNPNSKEAQYSINPKEIVSSEDNESFIFEGVVFKVFTAQLSDSRSLFLCRDGETSKYYLSLDEFCEPKPQEALPEMVRRVGFIAGDYTDGAKAQLFRCFHPRYETYLATVYKDECVSHGYEVEGVLGFVRHEMDDLLHRRYRRNNVYRYIMPDGLDRPLYVVNNSSEELDIPFRRDLENPFNVFRYNHGGMAPLVLCQNTNSGSSFPSMDVNCEFNGASLKAYLGYMSKIPIRDAQKPLYRCFNVNSGHRFLSIDANCEFLEGYFSEGILGFAL